SNGRKRTASISSVWPPKQASTIGAGEPRSTPRLSERALRSRAGDRRSWRPRGPGDEAVSRFRAKLAASGGDPVEINARIGAGLGEVLRRLIGEARVKRAAVSGGDTSGFAIRALGAYALEAIAPIAPG